MICLNRKCGLCQGSKEETRIVTNPDGSKTESQITCRQCDGTGIKQSLTLSDELKDLLVDMASEINDIKDKVKDIKEKVDEL